MVASVQAERRMSAVLPFCGPLIDIFIADDVQAVCSCPGCTRQMGPCTKCVCSLCVWTTFDKRYELSRVCASRARTADGQGGLSPPEVVNCLLYFTGHLPIFPTAAQSTLRIYRLHARLVANRQRFDSSGTHAPPSGPTRRVGGHARAHSTQS